MSVPAAIEAVAAPDSVDYQDSTYGVGNSVVADAEHIQDEQETYAEIHEYHQNTESEPTSLGHAIVFITIHNFDFLGLGAGSRTSVTEDGIYCESCANCGTVLI